MQTGYFDVDAVFGYLSYRDSRSYKKIDKHVKVNRKTKYTKEQIDEVIKLKKEGFSVRNVAKHLNIPYRSVYDIIKIYG